jgi:hypothetical protein
MTIISQKIKKDAKSQRVSNISQLQTFEFFETQLL